MKRRTFSIAFAAILAAAVARGEGVPQLVLQPVASGLGNIVGLHDPVDGSTDQLFVVRQSGQILVLSHGVVLPTPFLDLSARVSDGFEQGLLGLAFHPRYADNGFFFVNYTDASGTTVVSRFHRSADPNIADESSEAVVLRITQPFENHNGGDLHFGPDGYLYIGTGDGGSGGDPMNNAQRLDSLLGKLLRIDIDAGTPYAIPAGNPFVGGGSSVRQEIWAYGLRNPWRFSFDRFNGDLWIGDVGQGQWEEIDFQPAGQGGTNYGWRRKEGDHCYNPASGCETSGLTDPLFEYDHDNGCSVTGGFRYRGTRYPRMFGTYFFGDFCSGTIYAGIAQTFGPMTFQPILFSSHSISSFGEDESGELYLVTLGGDVFHLADARLQRRRPAHR